MIALWLGLCLAAAPPPPEALLSAAFAEGAWRPAGAVRVFRGDEIYEYMDGSGELPMACGYRALAVQELRHTDGRTVTAELYASGSSSDAYGIYSLRRQPGEEIVPLSHRARFVEGELTGWRGVYTFVLSAPERKSVPRGELGALARRIEARIADEGSLPALLACLPSEGRVPDSGRYFHGKFALDTIWFQSENVLGVSAATETVAARYAQPRGGALVVRYESAAAAQTALARWQRLRAAGEAAVVVERCLGLAFDTGGTAEAEVLRARLARALASPEAAWHEG